MPKPGRKRRSYDRKLAATTAITPVEYTGLSDAYDHLPDVFITYQRKGRSRGFFAADRFAGRGSNYEAFSAGFSKVSGQSIEPQSAAARARG